MVSQNSRNSIVPGRTASEQSIAGMLHTFKDKLKLQALTSYPSIRLEES